MELFGISVINILLWSFFGITAGAYAHTHDHRYVSGGILASALFGCLGAIVGGTLASFLTGRGFIPNFTVEALVPALIGALFLAAFYRISFTRGKDYIQTQKKGVSI